MKKIVLILALTITFPFTKSFSLDGNDTTFYLITCGPGTEVYSIYGHSALRMEIPSRNIDLSYNWGVFDFATPNFGLKFARGNLQYLLDTDTYSRFLLNYQHEKRWVKSQEINLTPAEKRILAGLITENLKPENVRYRYDFLFDNCATRIRDILEKAIGSNLIYSPSSEKRKPSFRYLTGTYQEHYPWLNFGIDLLLGTPCDKKAEDRDKMFLPLELQKEFTEAVINRDGKMIPVLRNPETVLDFNTPANNPSFFSQPVFFFLILCIALIIFTAMVREGRAVKIADIIVFSLFTLISLLLIFTNFFSLHHQLRYNLALLWISPFIPVCLAAIVLNRSWILWFRIVFVLCVVSFLIQILFSHTGNNAFLPLILIIMVRSSVRADYSWNPFSLKSF
jgi:hypothetical protein